MENIRQIHQFWQNPYHIKEIFFYGFAIVFPNAPLLLYILHIRPKITYIRNMLAGKTLNKVLG